jgi:thiosulfate dehydrogenase
MLGKLGLSLGTALALVARADAQANPASPSAAGSSAYLTAPMNASAARGRALMLATRDSLPANVGGNLRCVSCHLDEGRRPGAVPFTGVYARFPQYRSRSGTVQTLEERINGCFERSLNGRPLPVDGRDMHDIVSYMAVLSVGIRVGDSVAGQGVARLAPRPAEPARGQQVFAAECSRCHGADGAGTPLAPALWGAASYNIGAGMARLYTAAAFIQRNMPHDRAGTLTEQQAFDVAAYINTRPRPDFAPKDLDWPNGDAPPDVAYPTRAGRVHP